MKALNEELEKINVDITLDFSINKAIIIILFPARGMAMWPPRHSRGHT